MILPADGPEELKQTVSDAVEKTRLFFSPDSPLRMAEQYGGRPYERRIQQEQMAFAVAEAFEKQRNLCVEAPTGVGKSFAYLIPAIYHALSMHRAVLITTETINLQEQLVNRDLPLLRDLLGLNFTFVIAKGRSNYICKRRLALARGGHREEYLPMASLANDLDRLAEWVRDEAKDGSRSEIPFRIEPALWPCVCCETTTCMTRKCAFFHTCFYWKSRNLWDKADLVVANHALFFTDLKIREIEGGENCPLPPYCAVVFDEAHTLEDNAAEHLGLHVNSAAFHYFLNRLYNPVSSRGLLMRPGPENVAMRAQVSRLHDAADVFFSQFENDLRRSPEQCLRIFKPGFYQDTLSPMLGELEHLMSDAVTENDSSERDAAEHKTELISQREKCMAYRSEIEQFISMSLEEQVYWVEGRGNATASAHAPMELSSAPLNVAALLHACLFSKGIPVVLTSATLAVRDSLDYFVSRVGFSHGEGLILDSPFDYMKQAKLYLTRGMPLPNEQGYNDAAAERIRDFVLRTKGHAFVLFTSYGMLKYCAQKLEGALLSSGIELLVHGESLSRTAMLREFKKKKHAVIFGATSFWTGVDVPGEALSNVIITKLPFAVPTHPLIAARCERIRENGGEPFRDYSIPEAVLKFRQGIGRLIRSKTDTGIIVVLDPRIVSKQYGRTFLNSIPPCPIEYF